MEKISLTDHVRNEEVLPRVNEQRNILHEIRERKANWIGHILRRNCLLKQVIEGKIKGEMEVARKRGWKRCKKLLDDLKDKRGYSHLKEEALDRTMWRHRFGGGFGPVVRQHTEWMNMNIYLYTYIYIYIPLHLWRYSPFWALSSLTRRLHFSLSFARLLHPRTSRPCKVTLRTTSSHLILGYPTAFGIYVYIYIYVYMPEK